MKVKIIRHKSGYTLEKVKHSQDYAYQYSGFYKNRLEGEYLNVIKNTV